MLYNYKRYTNLTDEQKARLKEIDSAILELQREKSKILRSKTLLFEEERDYLASFIPDFYVDGTSGRYRKVRMNPKYTALWTGIRQAAEFEVFHIHKRPETATEEQIAEVKKAIIHQIDLLNDAIISKGLLWI